MREPGGGTEAGDVRETQDANADAGAHVLAPSDRGAQGRRAAEQRLRSARGHLDAVLRMLRDDRYCVDVLHQLTAVEGAIARARREILEAHARGCVVAAMGDESVGSAVDEVLAAVFGGRVPRPRGSERPVP